MDSNDRNKPTWAQQPGLLSEKCVEHLRPYRCTKMRAQAPSGLTRILPVFTTDDPGLRSTVPQTEYILVALDFKHICKDKVGQYPNGKKYRFKPLTEVGISYLDMRDVLDGRGQEISPGDRGSSWFRFMSPTHFIVEEYQDHWGHLCQSDGHGTDSFLFAFGKSKLVRERCIAERLNMLFKALRKRNRTTEEIASEENRKIIILTFGAPSVETTLSRLGLMWPSLPNVELMDVQRDCRLEMRFNSSKTRLEYVMESLGLRFVDNHFGKISHCAGNTAVFTIQVFLALFYKTQEQSVAFCHRVYVPWLRYTWVGHTLDRANVAPGTSARGRQENQMNKNDVPQVRDKNAFVCCPGDVDMVWSVVE